MSKRGAIVRLDGAAFPYVLTDKEALGAPDRGRGVIRPEQGGEAAGDKPAPLLLTGFLKERKVEWVLLELPLDRTVVSLLELPPMKIADARKALPFEFERKLPVSLDNFYWAYSFLESGAKGVKALAAGVPRSFLTPFLEALQAAEIVVRSVELGALRFHALQATGPDVLSVGMGEDTADLAVIKGGRPLDLKALELPPDPDLHPVMIAKSIEREAELHRCREVWFYGRNESGIRTAASSLRGINVKVAETLPGDGTKTPRGSFLLNLLPESFRTKRNPHNIILGLLMSLLVVAFYFQVTVKSRIDERALAEVTQELNTLRQNVDSASGPLKERENVIRSLKVLRPFFADRNRPFVALGELSRILPRDTWLVNFDMDEKGKIEIDGYSSRSSEILALLEESDQFVGAEMAGPVIVQPMGEHFSIRMYWEQVSHEGQ